MNTLKAAIKHLEATNKVKSSYPKLATNGKEWELTRLDSWPPLYCTFAHF